MNSASAATFSVSPSVVSNSYAGMITLQAGALSSGQTVLVEKFHDANGDGIVNSGEILVQSFLLTDGSASSIGGQRNVNVPGDAATPRLRMSTTRNIFAQKEKRKFIALPAAAVSYCVSIEARI